MRFALRDDDTSYFTDPSTLDAAYADIWSWCPVSLAVIPFAVETHGWGDPMAFRQGDRPHPLGENRELVRFLRDGIAGGRLEILLHGWRHQYSPGRRPGEWVPEFAHIDDPESRIREGREHLESALGQPIRVFVPPSGALSPAAYRAVKRLGLGLPYLHPLRHSLRQPDRRELLVLLKRLAVRVRSGRDYRDVLDHGSHREVSSLTLTPAATLPAVTAELSRRLAHRGAVCLATHHWELGRHLSDRTTTVAGLLSAVLDRLRRNDARPMTVGQLLEG